MANIMDMLHAKMAGASGGDSDAPEAPPPAQDQGEQDPMMPAAQSLMQAIQSGDVAGVAAALTMAVQGGQQAAPDDQEAEPPPQE